jgi:hypothetical protein
MQAEKVSGHRSWHLFCGHIQTEFGNDGSHEFPLFKIVHIEPGDGRDLAFLRIEPVNGAPFPTTRGD